VETRSDAPPPRLARLRWSLLRRCPNCASGNVFRSYFRQHDSCPRCGLLLDRGEKDFFIGAYTINLIVAEMIVFFGGLAYLRFSWPDVRWNALMYGLGALMIIAPIVLYPFSRQLWLATDLILRPPEVDDFAAGPVAGG
jgi:uncharacterized protein (DUF983 family)